MVDVLHRDDKKNRHNPVIPSPPSRLYQQSLWVDDLQQKSKWVERVKTRSTYLANLDLFKTFWNSLNRSETKNILAFKTPGNVKEVVQLLVINKIGYATLVIN